MCGGQALAELVEKGGHQVFQSGHRDARVELDGIQTSVAYRLDYVVYVDQMHCSDRSDVSKARLSPGMKVKGMKPNCKSR